MFAVGQQSSFEIIVTTPFLALTGNHSVSKLPGKQMSSFVFAWYKKKKKKHLKCSMNQRIHCKCLQHLHSNIYTSFYIVPPSKGQTTSLPHSQASCLPHAQTDTHSKKLKPLTRPAMGVESLFTRLMMPGFNWLIKLQIENKLMT